MLRDIVNQVTKTLKDGGARGVYSAFDAQPVGKKGEFFTVIGIRSFETLNPVYSAFTVYFPFRADIEIKVFSPEDSPLERLYSYYDENIEKSVGGMSGLGCRLSSLSVKHDSNINRLVLTCVMSANGIKKVERRGI